MNVLLVVWRRLWRLVAVVLGLALALWMVLLALAVGLLAIVWALLRGRRPVLARTPWGTRPSWPGAGARPGQGEVVDIEAREVGGTPPSPTPPSLPPESRG